VFETCSGVFGRASVPERPSVDSRMALVRGETPRGEHRPVFSIWLGSWAEVRESQKAMYRSLGERARERVSSSLAREESSLSSLQTGWLLLAWPESGGAADV